MLLINARTSGSLSSGAITEIDPREGAAIVGDNSVGKTTTLELIPLFFGHLPSQIVHSGEGRDPMLKFVLPTPESAIVFEYQRGPSPAHDMRFAVLRRSALNDAPEYRLYKGSFCKELFFKTADDQGNRVFLDDSQTIDAARHMGIEYVRKMTASDYRCVILGLRANNQDTAKLRQISASYSFGPVGKSLANLDRLVAAVIKKHVSFEDFIKVTVDMVLQELGMGAGLGRGQVSFHQNKQLIDQWLVNRNACARALRLTPKIEDLMGRLKDLACQEAVASDLRHEVMAIIEVKQTYLDALVLQKNALQTERVLIEQKDLARQTELDTKVLTANQRAGDTQALATSEHSNLTLFESKKAAQWELKVATLPSQRQQRLDIVSQIDLSEKAATEIVGEYTRQITQTQTQSGQQKIELERTKTPLRNQFDHATQALTAQEALARESFDVTAKAQNEELAMQIAAFDEQRGQLQAACERPRASAGSEANLSEAREDYRKFMLDGQSIVAAAGTATANYIRLQNEHEGADRRRLDANTIFNQSKIEFEKAGLALAPPKGSLLEALRASPNDEWKQDFAKIISQDLLTRTDLAPHDNGHDLAALNGDHAYNWSLDVAKIAPPEWIANDYAKTQVESARVRLQTAQDNLNQTQVNLTTIASNLEKARSEEMLATSRLSVFNTRKDSYANKAEIAQHKHDEEFKTAQAKARDALTQLQQNTRTLREQMQALDARQQIARQHARNAFTAQVAQLKGAMESALTAIDLQITQVEQNSIQRINGLIQQRDEHLSASGIDVEKIKSLRLMLAPLELAIAQLSAQEALVAQWQTWCAQGGLQRVDTLQAQATQAKEVLTAARNESNTYAQDCLLARRQFDENVSSLLALIDRTKTEVDLATRLNDDLVKYPPNSLLALAPPAQDACVTTLRDRVKSHRQKISSIETGTASLFNELKNSMTLRDSAVKDLIDSSLLSIDGQGIGARAKALCNAHHRIGPQIVANLNTTLHTVLSTISQFRKTIENFEAEVKSFNRRLQEGMSSVADFPWLTDLKLNMVTDFEDLGFPKNFTVLDDVIRLHNAHLGTQSTTELPADTTAEALNNFMAVIGSDGSVNINLGAHVTMSGELTIKGVRKVFRRKEQLENIDSNGLSTIVLISLLSGMINMIRGNEPIYIPWVSDEVGKFDVHNFAALMKMLKENKIDVITASPALEISQQRMFARRYKFTDRGGISIFRTKIKPASALATLELQDAS